ncbi:MAG TPA: iron ABC transporter permease [Chloroflexota bacterium]|nr:iron ABC transporter permease [Chloroflexota bacterium]
MPAAAAGSVPGRSRRGGLPAAVAILTAGLLALGALIVVHVTQGQANLTAGTVLEALVWPNDGLQHNIVRHVRLPRAAVGVLAGAALAVSGVLLQAVTRNPLASATTLGVNAGAYLAIVGAAIAAPRLLHLSPLLVAFAGGGGAALLVYLLAGAMGTTPIRLVLAGVAVSLACAAATATLQLLFENETAGLFFWGAGSLIQKDWSGAAYAWPRVAVGLVLALAVSRWMDILLLGDDVARSLGLHVRLARLGGVVLGVFLAAVIVGVAGPIGFVGLAAPHLVRLGGLRAHRALVPAAAVWGAVLVVGADVIARQVRLSTSEVPVGAVTALAGAPWLVWLTRRAATRARLAGAGPGGTPGYARPLRRLTLPWCLPGARWLSADGGGYAVVLAAALLALLVALALGAALGDLKLGPRELAGAVSGDDPLIRKVVLELRLPRMLVAALAGAALASSGTLLQGVIRNPLADPSIIGVTPGAGLGALLALIAVPGASPALVPPAAFLGAGAAFGIAYTLAWRHGVSPARLTLTGIAISAFCAAAIQLLVVQAGFRVTVALVWLSGSTYARAWVDLLRLVPWLLLLLPLALWLARSLDVLGLGDPAAAGLGLTVERTRALVLALGVALAAAAVATVGTVGFVGLVAPHTARFLAGAQHRRLLPLAAILGATLLVLADVIGRVVIAPKELPAGLVVALIGTPYFLWLLWTRRHTL